MSVAIGLNIWIITLAYSLTNKLNDMKEIKPLKNMWVCCGSSGNIDYSSIAFKRTDSIKRFVGDTHWSWGKWKSKGWSCIRVNICFEVIGNIHDK